jgi:hypothetical protein
VQGAHASKNGKLRDPDRWLDLPELLFASSRDVLLRRRVLGFERGLGAS